MCDLRGVIFSIPPPVGPTEGASLSRCPIMFLRSDSAVDTVFLEESLFGDSCSSGSSDSMIAMGVPIATVVPSSAKIDLMIPELHF